MLGFIAFTPTYLVMEAGMKHLLIVALTASLLAPVSAATLNKCTAADGSVSYSDAPCPGGSRNAATPDLTNAASSRPAGQSDFGDDPSQQLGVVAATVASARTAAQACMQDLKVRNSGSARCQAQCGI